MPDQSPATTEYDLGHYLRPLKRHRWLLIVCVVLGLFAGAAGAAAEPPSYSSAARVQVDATNVVSQQASINVANGRTNQPVNLDTEAQIVVSTTVGTIAKKILDSPSTVGSLLSRVSVTVPPNSSVLQIACKARSALAAQTCANAFATAYLQDRAAVQKATLDADITVTQKTLSSARKALQNQAKVVAQATAGPAKTYAIALQATLQTNINQLNLQLDNLVNTPEDPGRVIVVAGPGTASKVRRAILPLTGLILGVLLGIAAVIGRERYGRYVSNSDDLAAVGVDVIAEMPARRGGRSAGRRREAAARSRFDQRIASVVAGAFGHEGGIVYVAPVSPGQADSGLAKGLAAILAALGNDVEVVATAGTAPLPATAVAAVAKAFAEPPSDTGDVGLRWPGRRDPDQPEPDMSGAALGAFIRTPIEAAPGSFPATMRAKLDDARRRARYVIIEGDPASTDANAYVLAELSEASILVVDPMRTKRGDLGEVIDQISVTSSRLLGAALWRAPRRKVNEPQGGDSTLPNQSSSAGAHSSGGSSVPTRPVDAAR